VLARFAVLALVVLPVAADATVSPGGRCERAVATALSSCVQRVGQREATCRIETFARCSDGDATVDAALASLARKIGAACPDAVTVQAAGYGPLFDPQSLVERATDACLGDTATLVARSFGGPQGAVLAAADANEVSCLATAYAQGLTLLRKSLRTQASCIAAERAGRGCGQARTAEQLARLEARAESRTTSKCPGLASLIGLTPARFVARTAAQSRCMVATAHAGTAPLALDCGPRPGVVSPARGVWTRIVLDQAVWGTRCGDGTDYAFWLRLAPEGSPIERVVVDLAGGGVCIFGPDCAAVSASLLRATDDVAPSGGFMNTTAAVNPFYDWTLVYLPYCTQDLHIGGGTTNVFATEGVTVHRFGGVNVRTALGYLRDVLWAALDQQDAAGYRPDRLRVFFGGESAGGFGVQYNYHWLLDDLRWVRSTAVSDSGIALNNGEPFGVAGLGFIMTAEGASGWGTAPHQAPYCQSNVCAVGPFLQMISAARLGPVPEQGFLNVSNQVDNTQVSTTLFPNAASWVNALRASYCVNRDLPGVRYFLPARTTSTHTLLRSNTFMTSLAADGEILGAWLAGAMADLPSAADRVDEGTLTTSIPGVSPFPCALD
jgi:hypothetical protein